MSATSNTYIEGLDRDTSYEKYSNKSYFNARNFKVTSDGEISVGSLETEAGNELKVKIPNVVNSRYIDKDFIPNGGYNNTTVYINGHTETGINFSSLKSLKTILENLYSSEINSGDFKIILSRNRLYFIGLDAGDYYKDTSNPQFSVNIGDENMDPSTGNNTSWGGTAPLYYGSESFLKICGWGSLREYIIFFTTDSKDREPNSYGQIWAVKYDDSTNQFEGLDSNNRLIPSKHLIVNNKSNFSLYHRIGEVIGRYENQNIGRVYWTDDYNELRSINIFDNNTQIITAADMGIRSDVSFSQPIPQSIGSGSLPVGSVVQYTYRLRNSGSGAQTTFAPLSHPIKLSDHDLSTTSYQKYGGSFKNTADSRSVTYDIPYLDPGFDTIENILVIYEEKGVKRIWKFSEEFIGNLTSTTVTNSDIPDDAVEITLQEFSKINSTFTRTKSIAVKDNYLIAANNKTQSLDLNFDARAYRFNANRIARLFTSENIRDQDADILSSPQYTIDGSNPDYNIPEDIDAINPYNYDENIWDYSNPSFDVHEFQEKIDYKYKADGSTLGGEGPNISYEFTTKRLSTDNTSLDVSTFSGPPYINVNGTSGSYTLETLDNDGSNIIHSTNSSFLNHKSPLIEKLFTGYTRGEIYRFGIVFYSLEGSPSFVKWIGDIRFPFPHEFPISYKTGGPNNDYNESDALGIRFTVDVSSIKDQISGFRIVRVERKEEDMSRIEMGVTCPMFRLDGQNTSADFDQKLQNIFNDSSISEPDCYILDGSITTSGRLAAWKNECIFLGATGQLTPLDNLASDIDYAELVAVQSFDSTDNIEEEKTADLPKGYEFLHKLERLDYNAPTILTNSDDVGKRIDVDISDQFNPSEARQNFGGSPYPVLNKCWTGPMYTGEDASNSAKSSLGDRKTIIRYKLDPSSQWSDLESSTDVNSASDDWAHVVIGRKRSKSFGQYGGDSYEDRSNQRYISAGEFQIVNKDLPDTFTFDVFGGDTYEFYYDSQIKLRNIEASVDKSVDPRVSKCVCHNIETPINTGLRNKSEDFNNYAEQGFFNATTDVTKLYTNNSYNTVFLQEDIGREVFRTEDVFSNTVEEHSHEIRASRKKIDGELIDSWRFFPPAQTIEVQGNLGPINKIINFRDRIYFLQTQGLGWASINERASINSSQGTELTLGYGGILDDYKYISTNSGTSHQYSVVDSGSAIYYADSFNKKIMRFGGNGNAPLSDVKGLSSYFADLIEGSVEDTDQTLVEEFISPNGDIEKHPIGIHSEFDKRNNRIFITFLTGKFVKDRLETEVYRWKTNNKTISYSEKLKAFESFYDFTPSLYLSHGHKTFSVDPNNEDHVYEHERGNSREFYGVRYPSEIDIIVNDKSRVPKIFDNVEFNAEAYDSSGNDIWDEIMNRINVYNEYQDSGEVPLNLSENIERRFRKWRAIIPRNNDESSLTYNSSLPDDERIRGPWCHVRFIYDNDKNVRLILHDIETHYQEKPY